MKSDIEITRNAKLKSISYLAKKSGIKGEYLECYGKYKAKISDKILTDLPKRKGKLILVTSINPTPYGEGKTTQAIGLCDALNELGYRATVTLREPSMGPVFGIKGGATGGGYSQIVPMEDINLHFTGDMHALTSANNLLCAIIDNHIFQGNELDIQNVVFKRCLDLNDRALRNLTIHSSFDRQESFNITVASEMMAILCLASDFKDLKYRIGKIIVGYNSKNNPVYCDDLHATDAVAILLKDAIKPNIVQTLEGNLAFVHGGPFANIAHGCCSIISDRIALSLFDYCITEAGFGADLGAEKFLDIKCPIANLEPDLIVINATIRSLKHNGLCPKEYLSDLGIDYLKRGICNLDCHIENMQKYSQNLLVVINKFSTDKEEEIAYVIDHCKNLGVEVSISDTFQMGSKGGLEAASKIIDILKTKNKYQKLYDSSESIKGKIEKIAKSIYHANKIEYSDVALKNIKQIEKLRLDKVPVCIAKTQYSISDNQKMLGFPKNFTVMVKNVYLNNGAGFIVVLLRNILTMPGLGKNSAYLNMKIDDDKKISGLY